MKTTGLIFSIIYTVIMLAPLQTYAVGDKLAMNATLESRKVEREATHHESIKPNVQIPNENRILNEPMNKPIVREPLKRNKNKNIKKNTGALDNSELTSK
ncbi:MAG: hypothetical protein Q8S31_03710 [Alphaproteobacteria bacterium]|nr:hypothetical protein [Alphaproteobacteria bacterium]